MKLRTYWEVIKMMFREWKTIVTFIVTFALFYVFNAYIRNMGAMHSFIGTESLWNILSLLFAFSIGLRATMTWFGYYLFLLVNVVTAFLVAVVAYRTRILTAEKGFIPTMGIFLGVIAPSCTSCGVGLLGVFGVGAGVANIFPFDGYELSVAALLLLLYASYKAVEGVITCTYTPSEKI